MIDSNYLVKQLADELATPESGKQSIVLIDNSKTKVILFAFAAGAGLASMWHRSMRRYRLFQG